MKKEMKGSLLILASAFFYGSYGIWSRLMVGAFGEFSQAWTRGLFLLVVIMLIGLKVKFWKKIEKNDWKWFIIIALAGGLNQAPYFFGFEHLSIGTATLLFYAALVVGGYVLGKFVFREVLTPIKMISLVIAILGMIIIYGFTLSESQYIPAIATVIAGLMGASTVVLPKKLVGNYHEFQIMAGYFVMQVVCNLPLALYFHNPLPEFTLNSAWLAQIAYAVAMLFANFAAITGFSHLEASKGSLIGLAEILFGIVFGLIFFGEVLTGGIIAGGILIVVSAAIPSIVQWNQ